MTTPGPVPAPECILRAPWVPGEALEDFWCALKQCAKAFLAVGASLPAGGRGRRSGSLVTLTACFATSASLAISPPKFQRRWLLERAWWSE